MILRLATVCCVYDDACHPSCIAYSLNIVVNECPVLMKSDEESLFSIIKLLAFLMLDRITNTLFRCNATLLEAPVNFIIKFGNASHALYITFGPG
jgi:hypothetical protein